MPSFNDVERLASALRAIAGAEGKRLAISTTNSQRRRRYTLWSSTGGAIMVRTTGNKPSAEEQYIILSEIQRVLAPDMDAVARGEEGEA
jgi:hypothetical protein